MKSKNNKKQSLIKIQRISNQLGNPSDCFKIIHVKGTNGKGTVCYNIAIGVQESGYKVGLFSSPHFISMCERIAINQKKITYEEMNSIYICHEKQLRGLFFFDIMMFIAFIFFKRERVDYALIEVGVGGMYDSTNIVNPCLSVITNISMDHCDLLGNSLSEIAVNKAGIIKNEIPVVLGQCARHQICYDEAAKKNSTVYESDYSTNDYERENMNIARKALEVLGMNSLRKFYSLPLRYEKYHDVIFDIAHNKSAFEALKIKVLKEYGDKQNIVVIWNMCRKKEYLDCLKILHSFASKVYYFSHHNERLIKRRKALSLGLEEYNGQRGDITIVCGSIYFMLDVKRLLFNKG